VVAGLASCAIGLVALAGPASAAIGGNGLAAPGYLTGAGAPPLPTTTATAFVVVDADTGQILAAHNAHLRLAPASTLKTLTAITLLPELRAKSPVVAGSDAPAVDGTKAGIIAGATYTVNDLFTAMLMMSANDAAVALADANGGLPTTLAQMNAEAKYLQADDTVALTPDGLDAKGQSSSAYDLALIFRAGLKLPQFRYYLSLLSAQFPAPKGSFQIQTHDELLTQYPGMVGGKNGYTVAAEASYVGAATRNGHTIIVAMMRDVPNFWPEAKLLLNWGFAADAVATPVGVLVDPLVPVSASPAPTPAHAAAPVSAAPAAAAAQSAAAAVTAAASKHRAKGSSLLGVLGWTAVALILLVALVAAARMWRRGRDRRLRDSNYLSALSGSRPRAKGNVIPMPASEQLPAELELPLGPPESIRLPLEEAEAADRELGVIIRQREKSAVERGVGQVVGNGHVRVIVELQRPAERTAPNRLLDPLAARDAGRQGDEDHR
jgi:D-alanyl-D-alanine carboxypeptidase (penicillin-binding protein 5/6)